MIVDKSHIETISVLGVSNVIHIGYDLMDYIAADLLAAIDKVSNFVIITDNHIAPLYLQKMITAIQTRLDHNQRLLSRILPSGEGSKSRQIKASIEDFLLDSSCTRDTCLIALGGGVIGDLVGYVASTFMRGISFVQIPTTLLAMVDSSIGGKTAIDTSHGKNLIGTFWQPKRIYLDLAMLKTLPKRELANGMAEVIKTAAISSKTEFIKLETCKSQIESAILDCTDKCNQREADLHRALLVSVIGASARFKAKIVTEDEREGGLRGLLNFGHSIGHAYEALLSPTWLHGECVSLGLLHEIDLSISLGYCSPDVLIRLKKCLELYNLPVEFDQDTKEKLLLNDVMNTMKVDKKNKGAQKRIVLLSAIGKTLEQKASDVPDSALESVLAKYIKTENNNLITTKSVHATTENEENWRGLACFRLLSAEEDMRGFIKELSSVLCEKFGLTCLEKNGGSEIKCFNEDVRDNIYIIYFTSKAGSTQVCTGRYEYVVLPQQTTSQLLLQAMRFIKNILHPSRRHISSLRRTQSTFITPTVSNYDSVVPTLFNQWVEQADAIEFRVDYLTPMKKDAQAWINTAGAQLAHLRQLTNLPIIYTVRTVPQAGKFDPADKDLYYQLLQWGLYWGCDYVDVELTTLSDGQFSVIVNEASYFQTRYPVTKIIASFHDPVHRYSWSDSVISQMYSKAREFFDQHDHPGVIKLVGYANKMWDNFELEKFRHCVDPDNNKELIFINMGPLGKLSRVSNQFLSPATHPTLFSAAAPGQLSVEELASIRKMLSIE